jgi:hypothetical protein
MSAKLAAARALTFKHETLIRIIPAVAPLSMQKGGQQIIKHEHGRRTNFSQLMPESLIPAAMNVSYIAPCKQRGGPFLSVLRQGLSSPLALWGRLP